MVQTRPPKAITTTDRGMAPEYDAFSFIRTMTVGSGISPDLLTNP
ncbi:hypothetical protein Z950_3648 [Sulfitobacter mediterraneus KCTC 32188]|nr:hypothetical protein Z950_3648 [Sulfitobacter mediterraneus KCTC 32188]